MVRGWERPVVVEQGTGIGDVEVTVDVRIGFGAEEATADVRIGVVIGAAEVTVGVENEVVMVGRA
jgi:hypothetical protein